MFISVEESMWPKVLVAVHSPNQQYCPLPYRFTHVLFFVLIVEEWTFFAALAQFLANGQITHVVDSFFRHLFFPLSQVLLIGLDSWVRFSIDSPQNEKEYC